MRDKRILYFQSFKKFPDIIHGISTKDFGSIRINVEVETKNLRKFLKVLGVDIKNTVFMNQIHGNNISVIENSNKKIIDNTDGLITSKENIFLCVIIADCLPVIFYYPVLKIIGVAHVGYKGILNGILDSMIYKIKKLCGNTNKVLVGIGPSIERDCYDVDFKRFDLFRNKFNKFKNIYKIKNGKYFVDLKQIAYQILIQNGITKENIEILPICTRCDSRFFSNRRGDTNSRFVTIIGMT